MTPSHYILAGIVFNFYLPDGNFILDKFNVSDELNC